MLQQPPVLPHIVRLMNRLSYVKTDSYVSLVDLEEEETPEVEPPVFVFGVDCHGAYLRHQGADVPTGGEIFVERRINSADSPAMTLLRLECGGRSSSEYLIILDTNHQAFSRPRSSVLRSLNSFYYLSSILKVCSLLKFISPIRCLLLTLERQPTLRSALSACQAPHVGAEQSAETLRPVRIPGKNLIRRRLSV